jgi:AcrR family transcriptional regulator
MPATPGRRRPPSGRNPVVGETGARRRLAPEARRREIIAATIDTVAALGYRSASFAKIAERAGLSSTRLISYHFAGRDELMSATVEAVYRELDAHLAARLAAAADPRAELLAYVRGVVEFVGGHRVEMHAMTAIFVGFRDEAGASRSFGPAADERSIGLVEDILRRGQAAGCFRAFAPFVLASVVQRSVDGLPFLIESRPELDLDAYADELVETVDRATRRREPDADGDGDGDAAAVRSRGSASRPR